MHNNTLHITIIKPAAAIGILFFLFTFSLVASEQNLDSLRTVLANEKHDEKTLDEYVFNATNLMLLQHTESRILICRWALKHASKQKLHNTVANAMFGIAKAYGDEDDYINTTHWCISVLEYCEKHNIEKLKTDIFQLLGYVYYFNNQYDKAGAFYKKSIVQARRFNDSTMLFNGYAGLAVIAIKNGLVKSQGTQPVYNYLKEARRYMRKKTPDDKIYYYSTFSKLLTEIGEYDSALIYVNTVKQFIDSSELKDYYSTFYLYLGRIYHGKKNWVLAEKYYQTGFAYCQREGLSLWAAEHLLALSKTYQATGRYKEAYFNYRKSTAISDSIVNAKNFAKAADIENKYEREKKNKQITRLHKDNEIKQLKIDKETARRKRLYLITALLILTAIFLIVWVVLQIKNNRRRKESYLLLQQKNMEIQSQAEALALQSKLIGKYQGQVSPDFIFNAVDHIQHFIVQGDKEKSVAQLQGFSKLMRQTLTHAELELLVLEQEINHIKDYVLFEQERLGNTFSFVCHAPKDPDEILLPSMFIQPFIENAIKHALKKQHVQITLDITVDDFLYIIINDTGPGFDVSTLTREKGRTIYLVKTRLAMLYEAEEIAFNENYFRIISSPVTGTMVHIVLPLKYKY